METTHYVPTKYYPTLSDQLRALARVLNAAGYDNPEIRESKTVDGVPGTNITGEHREFLVREAVQL